MFCRVFILFISTSASTNTRNFNRYSARDIDKSTIFMDMIKNVGRNTDN